MSDELPWPKADSSIFTIKNGGQWCTLLKWSQGEHFGYSEGYSQAAKAVFAHIAETRSGLDSSVFPLVFLWRQAIELELKKVIADGAKLRKVEAKPQYHHYLVKLWAIAKKEIVALYDHEPPGTDGVERVLTELEILDPETTGFRFPEDREGKPNLTDPPEHLDLPNLHEVLEEVYTFLSCASDEISRRLEYEAEMEAEMAREEAREEW